MCKCNQKELCCKMQKEGLRVAIKGLKDRKMSSNSVWELLTSTRNLLQTYNCLPCSRLIRRIESVRDSISTSNSSPLSKREKISVDILIAELTAFLDNY